MQIDDASQFTFHCGGQHMRRATKEYRWPLLGILGTAVILLGVTYGQEGKKKAEPEKRPSSYMPVVINESFGQIMERMKAAKPEIAERHQALLKQRYDLSDRPANGVMMTGGKKA